MGLNDFLPQCRHLLFAFFSEYPVYIAHGFSVYKCKNHFSEMKRDKGMSCHEKEGEQEDAYTKTGNH